MTTVGKRNKEANRVIAEGPDFAPCMPEFCGTITLRMLVPRALTVEATLLAAQSRQGSIGWSICD